MVVGRGAARVGWTGLEVDAAKLARRLMQWHGATKPVVAGAAAAGGTGDDAPPPD